MNKLLQSKPIAWLAFAVVIVILVVTFPYRHTWWAFIDIFFAFMTVFSHVVALTIEKLNPYGARKLDKIALYLLVLTVLAVIGELIALLIC